MNSVSCNISRLETALFILEAKLNSVPGLENISADVPNFAGATPATTAAPEAAAPAGLLIFFHGALNNFGVVTEAASGTP